ncbi:SDR family oxidoreductase [Sphaerisporangium rubeum]|uniref:NAD(P)-dependent dehydrogenase (Short-subunit alcohol dehydrogenase family) n=1 Tax=Sphaerisporangium rubeum TaxID=321317 RepID=A0A7X0IM70_9ACTN|nr:SDR family oxidoreductase [Sphaerisporangium rubeum]MBB6476292.1 NAD(P)-dependent dehydrogenase (short-subunit alcohol dehydrogenase family) [Sphaerisporangium rubeum]
MKIQDSVVLVTGGNRGIGKALVEEALARGARTVYAGARDPETVTTPGAVPLRLDVTDPASVAAAARQAGDVRVLVNNAGVSLSLDILTADLDQVRQELEVNYLGALRMIQTFAPIIEANGGGHIQNVNSALGLAVAPGFGAFTAYAATKAALLMATNGLRDILPARGVDLSSLHVGFTDTDMTRGLDVQKNPVADVARKALDGIESDAAEVLADEVSVRVKGLPALDPAQVFPRSAA